MTCVSSVFEVGSNPLVEILRGAGLFPVMPEVRIPNYKLNWLVMRDGKVDIREPLPQSVMWPDGQKPEPGKGSVLLLHMWMPHCQSCYVPLQKLDARISEGRIPEGMRVMLVAFGTNVTAEIADEMVALKLQNPVHLDEEGGLAERLGTISVPSTYLVDEAGFVVAYRSGVLDFESKAVNRVFEAVAEHRVADRTLQEAGFSLHRALVEPHREWMSRGDVVNYLNMAISLAMTLCVFGVVCYAWVKILRKRAGRQSYGNFGLDQSVQTVDE